MSENSFFFSLLRGELGKQTEPNHDFQVCSVLVRFGHVVFEFFFFLKNGLKKKTLIGNPQFLVPSTTLMNIMNILRKKILRVQFLSDFQKLGVKIFGRATINREK